MERRTDSIDAGQSRHNPRLTIIHFGIACCAVTMAVVVAVAVTATG